MMDCSRRLERRCFRLILFLLLLPNSHSWMGDTTAAESSTATMDQYDWELPPSVFGSRGRLFAVDLAMRAVEHECSTVAIALCCNEGIVVVSTLPDSPYLLARGDTVVDKDGAKEDNQEEEEESKESSDSSESSQIDTLFLNYQDIGVSPTLMPPFARIRDDVLAITAGNPIHSQLLQEHLTRTNSRRKYPTEPSSTLARQLADRMQQATQHSDRSMLRASMIICDSAQQQLWRIDPTGQFWLCHAVVAGRCARATEQILLRELSRQLQPSSREISFELLSAKEAIVLARDSIKKSFESSRTSTKLPRMVAIVSHKDASSSSEIQEVFSNQEVMDI